MARHLPSFLRPRALVLLVALAAALLIAACTGESAPPKWDARSVATSIKDAPFTPVVLNGNIGRERSRVAIALFKPDQTLVLQGEITAKFFRIANDPEKEPTQGVLVSETGMTARTIDVAAEHDGHSMRFDRDERAGRTIDVALRTSAGTTIDGLVIPAHDGALSTIFTGTVDFTETGMWGAQLQVKTGGKTYRDLLVTFAVLDRTAEPSIGAPAFFTPRPG